MFDFLSVMNRNRAPCVPFYCIYAISFILLTYAEKYIGEPCILQPLPITVEGKQIYYFFKAFLNDKDDSLNTTIEYDIVKTNIIC